MLPPKCRGSVTTDMQAISAELYEKAKQQQQQASASTDGADAAGTSSQEGASEASQDGDVMDADFEMVDDDKKN